MTRPKGNNPPDVEHFTIEVHKKYILPAYGTWKESVHVFDRRSVNALTAAWLAERPLLVRGDPGTGKSQLARAAAVALGWQFITEVVNAHTDIQDLWFRFDAVSRLGQAQLLAALGAAGQVVEVEQALNPAKFLCPAALWWAYDWASAERYYRDSEFKAYHPDPEYTPIQHNPDQSISTLPKGAVLLIDEIDKADTDLPNSLLETLDNGRFRVPWIKESIGYRTQDPNALRPLVVITTNEDRQLPAAFVRRCLVLNLVLPDSEAALIEYLRQRGIEHFSDQNDNPLFDDKVLREAAKQVYQDRLQAQQLGFKAPGQAEYLDLLRVLARMKLSTTEQLAYLKDIQDFALKKHPGMKQSLAIDEMEQDEG